MHHIAIVNEHDINNVPTHDIIIIMIVMTLALVFFLYLIAVHAARRPYNDSGYPRPEPWAGPLPGSPTHVGDVGAHLIYPDAGASQDESSSGPAGTSTSAHASADRPAP